MLCFAQSQMPRMVLLEKPCKNSVTFCHHYFLWLEFGLCCHLGLFSLSSSDMMWSTGCSGRPSRSIPLKLERSSMLTDAVSVCNNHVLFSVMTDSHFEVIFIALSPHSTKSNCLRVSIFVSWGSWCI